MNILFVCCYINNSHLMKYSRKFLEKNLVNCNYEYICLNDAPDIENDEKNYVNVCDMITGDLDCYKKIKEEAVKQNFIHIKIPQNIHSKETDVGGWRHSNILTWFCKNVDNVFTNYKNYDYLCYIDSDVFLRKKFDGVNELKDYDIIAPMIQSDWRLPHHIHPHAGLTFINLKTVLNIKEMDWGIAANRMNCDTGSKMSEWLLKNKNYKIKQIGFYNGFWNNTKSENLKILKGVHEIDSWFNDKFYHFRGGSCGSIGMLHERIKRPDEVKKYIKRFNNFLKYI